MIFGSSFSAANGSNSALSRTCFGSAPSPRINKVLQIVIVILISDSFISKHLDMVLCSKQNVRPNVNLGLLASIREGGQFSRLAFL